MLTAVVTGSASGMGAAISAALQASGLRVIGIDRHRADVVADLAEPEGRASAIAAIRKACDGKLDRLVCCAGIGSSNPVADILAVNYFGTVELLDGLLDVLQSATSPAAVAIGSTAAFEIPSSGHPARDALLAGNPQEALGICTAAGNRGAALAYAASKNALTCAVRQRAAAWGAIGVRLNIVAPGPIQTPLYETAASNPLYADAIRAYVPPIARVGRPEEVAEPVMFLLSEKASYIHGSVIAIDGGITAKNQPTRF